MCNYVTFFQMVLKLLANQLSQGNLDNFDHLKSRSMQHSVDTGDYQNKIEAYLAFSRLDLTPIQGRGG